jgi:head-tail adaptor
MSFARLLRHEVSIVRRVAVLDAGEPTYDGYGQPVTELATVGTWQCRIEPKALASARELPLLSQAGAIIADHTLWGYPADLSEADRLVEVTDGREFEVTAIEDAGGAGHHIEVQAREIVSESPPEPEPS